MKHFIWRLYIDALSTLDNILKCGLDVGPICHLCGDGGETSYHLFLCCREVLKVWKLSPLHLHGEIHTYRSFRNLLWYTMHHFRQEYTELLVCIAWEIWKGRNLRYFEGRLWDTQEVIQCAYRTWSGQPTEWQNRIH